MANLDRRGWNAGAAESAWNSAKGGITAISGALNQRAGDLDFRANLVDEFENGMYSGGMPIGFPLADPVNSYSGNLIHAEVDLALPTRGAIGLLLSRTYNSRDPRRGLFGVGWTSSLEWKVLSIPDGFVVVRCADGKRDRYDLAPDGTWVGDFGVHHHLAALNGDRWQLTLAGRRVFLSFNAQGELESIADRNGNVQSIERDSAGRARRLSDGLSRWVELEYGAEDRPRLARDSSGAEVGYVFDEAGRLVRATDPTGAATSYAYDADGRLATITDALGNTVLRNRYDARRPGAGAGRRRGRDEPFRLRRRRAAHDADRRSGRDAARVPRCAGAGGARRRRARR